jgi:hypothetical protein
MTPRKAHNWESELWAYISGGDGQHCPLHDDCKLIQSDTWCASDNLDELNRLTSLQRFGALDALLSHVKGGNECRIFQLVELLAEAYLKEAQIDSLPVPADILSLIESGCTLEVREVPLKAYHGAIWRLDKAWIIQLKDTDTPAEKKFSLFHEGFHILAHSRGTPVFKKAGAAEGSFNELLADYFAACVLMPRQQVKEKWPEVRDPDAMAKLFDVPRSAMRVRLSLIGLGQ